MQLSDQHRFNTFCEQNQIQPDLYLHPSEVGAYFFRANTDGSVSIDRQDAANGIPFTTFSDIVMQQERVDDQIEMLMEGVVMPSLMNPTSSVPASLVH